MTDRLPSSTSTEALARTCQAQANRYWAMMAKSGTKRTRDYYAAQAAEWESLASQAVAEGKQKKENN